MTRTQLPNLSHWPTERLKARYVELDRLYKKTRKMAFAHGDWGPAETASTNLEHVRAELARRGITMGGTPK